MKHLSRKATLVAAWTTVGVLGASALTGVAMAADSNPSPTGSPSTASSSTASSSTASSSTAKQHPRAAELKSLGKRVLHGEFTLQTKAGAKTFDTEIGVITAVSPTSVTVKSSDGFTQTWTLDATTRVRADQKKGTVADLKTGETLRLVGPTTAGTATALLALVRPA
jgi:hypothetical protein